MKQITITDGRTGKPIREPAASVARQTADGLRDPSGAAKDTAEREWETALLKYWSEQRERIKKRLEPGIPKGRKALGDLPKRLDVNFWRNENEELLALFLPLISKAAVGGASTLEAQTEALGLMLDWTLPNAEAVEWARRYSYKLIKGINATTKTGMQRVLSSWLDTPGSAMGDLFGALDEMFAFGQSRAQMIGVTEVTRAYFEGNQAAARATEAEGLVKWKKTWQTNNDALVCVVLCAPLHGKSVIGTDKEFPDGAGQGPPRHPRCRCWATYEPVIE
ncbi:MAG: hypothetical protein KAJ19_30120 [Gammaproteobacteria bacterium]|nr:hypothetical protein [Gammaproteobacteria bacterium]